MRREHNGDGRWCVVRVTADRMGRRRLAYFAGLDLLGGPIWYRSPGERVLIGEMHDAGSWRVVASQSDLGGRISLCRLDGGA